MEFKHFSHNHGLVFNQLPQGSKIKCSGCKTPGSGNIYACWQCSYFLHEQCFRAARSLKHPSHPLHPLTLMPFPTYPSGSFVCNSCNLGGEGFSYSCSQCQYDIHVDCDLMHNANPHVPPSAVHVCKNPVHEMAWLYYCRECNFGTHLKCVTSGIKQQNVSDAKTEEELMRELELKFAKTEQEKIRELELKFAETEQEKIRELELKFAKNEEEMIRELELKFAERRRLMYLWD